MRRTCLEGVGGEGRRGGGECGMRCGSGGCCVVAVLCWRTRRWRRHAAAQPSSEGRVAPLVALLVRRARLVKLALWALSPLPALCSLSPLVRPAGREGRVGSVSERERGACVREWCARKRVQAGQGCGRRRCCCCCLLSLSHLLRRLDLYTRLLTLPLIPLTVLRRRLLVPVGSRRREGRWWW